MKKVVSMFAIAAIFAAAGFSETNAEGDSASVWQPYNGAEIKFDVLRKGKPFGEHIVSFEVDSNGLMKATTEVNLKVKVGPFTAFKYALDSVETWNEHTLVALEGKTNDNGDKTYVRAVSNDLNLTIDGSAYSGDVPLGVIPSSHWNMVQIRWKEMLSTEDGRLIPMVIVPKGTEILTVAGEQIVTRRYLLDSDIDIALWYDDQGRWLKLTFEARGQTIEYRLTQLY